MIGEKEGAWLMCHWGTRRKGRRPASFTSEIANMNTNEIVLISYRKKKKKETSKKAWSPGIGTSSGAVSLLSDRSLSGNGVLVSNRDCVGVKCTEDRGFSSY